MAMKTELKFEIGKDGTIKLEVGGVKGKKCLDLTKALEKELGIVLDVQKTGEYYENVEVEEVEIHTKK
jgi:hypothetical protein